MWPVRFSHKSEDQLGSVLVSVPELRDAGMKKDINACCQQAFVAQLEIILTRKEFLLNDIINLTTPIK